MHISGRVLNGGCAKGEAVVFDVPFSFIGDMNPATGEVTIPGHHLFGTTVANKILVIPTGKGGTIAPFIAYQAKRNGTAPAAVLCNRTDSVTLECALTIDIPIVDGFDQDITKLIANGSEIVVNADDNLIEIPQF